MAMKSENRAIERTAKAEYMHNGRRVMVGQIVGLTPSQVKKLAEAGCVELEDAANADVPVRDMPATVKSSETTDTGTTINPNDGDATKAGPGAGPSAPNPPGKA